MAEYDDVYVNLTSTMDRKRTLRICELKKGSEAENIRYEAYCDGVDDVIKWIMKRAQVVQDT